MKDDIELFIQNNNQLLKLLRNLIENEDIEFLKALNSNNTFIHKIKESLDYYKPRKDDEDIKPETLFRSKNINTMTRELLHEISTHLVNINIYLRI